MASLGSDPGKRGTGCRVLLRAASGKRHTIRLGRVTNKLAETAWRMIDSLEAANAAGHSPDRETAEWVGRPDDEMHGRLVKVGFVPPRERAQKAIVTLGQHFEQRFGSLGRQKPNTARTYVRTRQLLGRSRAGRRAREGDQRLDRQHVQDPPQALPRGAAGGRECGDRNSGFKSGKNPPPSTPVTGHRQTASLPDDRAESLDVVNNAEHQYSRQGSNL